MDNANNDPEQGWTYRVIAQNASGEYNPFLNIYSFTGFSPLSNLFGG